MTDFRIENMFGQPIASVDDWLALAPPRGGAKHWKDGRSAKELAKAWFPSGLLGMPNELRALLDSVPATRNARFDFGIAEKVTRLDAFDPGHRNHDLVLVGQASDSRLVVALEAKSDESFGATVVDALAGSRRRVERGLNSDLPARVAELCGAVLGCRADDAHALRYQLLYGIAGTLIEAKDHGAELAVFVVHEFVTDCTHDAKHDANRRDLAAFFKHFRLELRDDDSILKGPIRIPGGAHVPGSIPLWFGKVVTNLRGRQIA